MTEENINFVDLACILKITPGTLLEKFGGLINSSFFDAVNLAGTLKQKGLIDFSSNYPGPNEIVLTDAAKVLINEANSKAGEPFDQLDQSILNQLSGGKRVPVELGSALNLHDRDLALRLYKLYKQGYILYELKNGGVELTLTENGFLKANSAQNANVQTAQESPVQQQEVKPNETKASPEEMLKNIPKPQKKINKNILEIIIVIILLILLIYVLRIRGYI